MRSRRIQFGLSARCARRVRRRLVVVFVAATAAGIAAQAPRPSLPERLSDADFWALSQSSSESGGYFRGAEHHQPHLERAVVSVRHSGSRRADEARAACIWASGRSRTTRTWRRRGRRWPSSSTSGAATSICSSMYKAIFELSKDRADFVSMLFAKPRPAGVSASVHGRGSCSRAFGASATSEALYEQTPRGHRGAADEDARAAAARRATWPASTPSTRRSTRAASPSGPPDLRRSDDGDRCRRRERSYLASEDGVRVPEGLEIAQPRRARGRRLRRAEGDSCDRDVPQGARRTVGGVLPVERRAVPVSGRQVGRVLPERGDVAARRVEHVHPVDECRGIRAADLAELGARAPSPGCSARCCEAKQRSCALGPGP